MLHKIENYDTMPPFLMSLVSDSDLWMYVSSHGGLTAGRRDEEHCLFPYVTDDQLHRYSGKVGPVTTLRITRSNDRAVIWEPFARFPQQPNIERGCYKSSLSDCIIFEEKQNELGLTFRYSWRTSSKFGFVRTASITNNDQVSACNIEIFDGLVNILPAGATTAMQQKTSCLIDAYTRCEIDDSTGLGLYSMTAEIVDRAIPAESLTANTVWTRGLSNPTILLTADSLQNFIQGESIQSELLLTGRRGAYLVAAAQTLGPIESISWDIVCDVNKTQDQVVDIQHFLQNEKSPRPCVQESITESSSRLERNIAAADGQQISKDLSAVEHHKACVLFNIMRGGVFSRNYSVSKDDFSTFVRQANTGVHEECVDFLQTLAANPTCDELINAARNQHRSATLQRLTYEYLPLSFSRRHGDPSRPWNHFSIEVNDAEGHEILNYQGNWRDIFQNWEALCASFPEYIESVIAKFVNASTIDGFNPYRISREGLGWEHIEPDNPWSNIGYWGDHQIVYLLKLLEMSRKYHPERLPRLLDAPLFTYANVPYRIKPYSDIVQDSRQTIEFNHKLDAAISESAKTVGSDARLLTDLSGAIVHVSLAEKLLVPLLSKICNLVLDGGIWMNTQRPEWNDANNALVGSGVSMVTACYVRRYLTFCQELFADAPHSSICLSSNVAEWLSGVNSLLIENLNVLNRKEVSSNDRRRLLDGLGIAFGCYRENVYQNGLSEPIGTSIAEVQNFYTLALRYIDHTILANRREEGLYNSYNLIDLSSDGAAHIAPLGEMLEGQVAAISSGLLGSQQVGKLIDSLFDSQIYRPDQKTFMLYPARPLPGFLEKNIIPKSAVQGNALLNALIETGDRSILVCDAAGNFRFNSRFRNADCLQSALDNLKPDQIPAHLIAAKRQSVLRIYEDVFDHRTFTGRAGTMYSYEGLGCVYWHMVSKLLLAVQDSYLIGQRENPSAEATGLLASQYYRIREGMGFNKSAHDFGAFPADPYSHTSAHSGARQPGMTGQAKEDILLRWGELGVSIADGRLVFAPTLLRRREFLTESASWAYYDVHGNEAALQIPAGSLAFTFCGVPVIYTLTTGPGSIQAHGFDGSESQTACLALNQLTSKRLFNRTGELRSIEVHVPDHLIVLD